MSKLFLDAAAARRLTELYGSPLYVYDEQVLRRRCREMKNLVTGVPFGVSYSAKANSNLALLRIVHEEGLEADAMSPGEIYLEQQAGFAPDQIFYIGNNVSADEMRYAVAHGVTVSVDSLAQLELYGRVNPGGEVAVRFNPGVGVGHHAKVVTGGKKTKFGVQAEFAPQVKEICARHRLRLVGVNQHLGSLFLEPEQYLGGVRNFLTIAAQFEGLRFIDLGGGFGVPYKPEEHRLDLGRLSAALNAEFQKFRAEYGADVRLKTEPGRYVVAECGVLLGTVQAVKENYGHTYIGTDIGMNVLMRPVLYDSWHEVTLLGREDEPATDAPVTVVGNICESGDILARDRMLPAAKEGDILAVSNAGAYGYSMASGYNCRLRPAEVLRGADGHYRLIRRRDTLEDLMRGFVTE